MFRHLSPALTAIVLAGFLAVPSAAFSQDILISPDTQLRELLLRKLSGGVPDFDGIARESRSVLDADEFDRATALEIERDRLNAVWSDLSEVKALQFTLETQLGQYDSELEAFAVPLFAPGTSISGLVPVTFRNAYDARFFPVPLNEARALADRALTGRHVDMTVTLNDLAASALQSGAIEGRVAEVVIMTKLGAELGRYSPITNDGPDDGGSDLDADAVAGGIAETLGIPVAGQTWAQVLPFLRAQPFVHGTGGNFSGLLFSMENGDLDTQRPLDEYRDLTLVFAPTEAAVQTAFQEGTRRSLGFSQPRPFGALDCITPGVVDRCGIMRFEKIGDIDILVDVMTVAERSGVTFDSGDALAPFGEGVVNAMEVAETQVGYASQELGGQIQQGAGAKMYWAGDLQSTRAPLLDLRVGFSETYSAKTMLWVIDGQRDRTIYVSRSSLP